MLLKYFYEISGKTGDIVLGYDSVKNYKVHRKKSFSLHLYIDGFAFIYCYAKLYHRKSDR